MLNRVNSFCQLVLAKESPVWQDMVDNDYDDLGDHYTLAGEEDNVYAVSIDIDFVATADIVSVIGGREGDYRAYTSERTVFVAKDGSVWFNEADFEEYFC